MRIMDESATAEEYCAFAERLAAMALRLQARAIHVGLVVDGAVAIAADGSTTGSDSLLDHQNPSTASSG